MGRARLDIQQAPVLGPDERKSIKGLVEGTIRPNLPSPLPQHLQKIPSGQWTEGVVGILSSTSLEVEAMAKLEAQMTVFKDSSRLLTHQPTSSN